jgi:hypothetical protein
MESDSPVNLFEAEKLKEDLIDYHPKDFSDCLTWARILFEKHFVWKIKNQLFTYPLNALDHGIPFWSARGGTRRCVFLYVYKY